MYILLYIIRDQLLMNYTCNSHLLHCAPTYNLHASSNALSCLSLTLFFFPSQLSVLQLLDCPSAVLGDRGSAMQGDRVVCWLLVLLAVSSGTLLPSNEPLSAPRVFLSFKGRSVCHAESQLSLALVLL